MHTIPKIGVLTIRSYAKLIVDRRNITAPQPPGNAEAGAESPEIDHRVCLPAIQCADDPRVAGATRQPPDRAPLPRVANPPARPPSHPSPAIKPPKMSIMVRRNVIPQPIIAIVDWTTSLPIPLLGGLGGQFAPEDFINCVRITTSFRHHDNPQTMAKITIRAPPRVHPHLTQNPLPGLRPGFAHRVCGARLRVRFRVRDWTARRSPESPADSEWPCRHVRRHETPRC